jgi:hypothetical protein
VLIAREVRERILVDVAHVEHALAGEQLHVAENVGARTSKAVLPAQPGSWTCPLPRV